MVAVNELYAQEIRHLPAADRLHLLALIAHDLAAVQNKATRHITELRGLGKELWQEVDAQQYVNELRSEWEREV